MVKNPCISLPSFLLISSLLLQGISAVRYIITNNVPNHPGGIRFEREIGVPYTLQTMNTINNFIWNVLEEPTDGERKNIPVLNVFISDFTWAAGYTNGDFCINISAQAIQSYPPGGAKFFFTSLIRNFTPSVYPKPGSGRRWDEGYGVTERFLEYCDSLRKGFTVSLNRRMRFAYSDTYFVELLGKPVGQLWAEYKAKYGNIPARENDGMPYFKY
ncbi:hypothetical protein RD792_001857 [Penstemon davidsonii]|uniref:Uncharacterized protein n=1 Tax=Penstemon davidsonii TaxID=160366 RepID=A0ABR0DPH1_9LAMI|nr:hypothetical protein RD792_001857 [Penstemon davidsonii]